MLNKAILEGYHTLLTIGRFPICYINIEMDPILVDVNVHPTKLEGAFIKRRATISIDSEQKATRSI